MYSEPFLSICFTMNSLFPKFCNFFNDVRRKRAKTIFGFHKPSLTFFLKKKAQPGLSLIYSTDIYSVVSAGKHAKTFNGNLLTKKRSLLQFKNNNPNVTRQIHLVILF